MPRGGGNENAKKTSIGLISKKKKKRTSKTTLQEQHTFL